MQRVDQYYPEELLACDLARHGGGFAVFEGMPGSVGTADLLDEALRAYSSASYQESREEEAEELRGGKPRRSLSSAEAGPLQDSLYHSPDVLGFLSELVGLPVLPSGSRGSYSFYARAGDFLELHRDIETCDVSLITVLHDNTPSDSSSGALVLYPGRTAEPLSAIRRRPTEGADVVKLVGGQTIVLLGGLVPHCVLPVAPSQERIISVLCYQAFSPADGRG